MERSEKRKLERERQKLQKHNKKEDSVNVEWYRSLPVSRKIFLGKLYEAKIIQNDNTIAMIMDKCIMTAMDDNTDLSIILMKKIIKEYNDYILEYKEFLDKYGDGGMDMIENVKLREEVKNKMKGLINDGIEKIKGMAMLKKKYNLPGAELSELWIDCKVELDQEKKLKKIGMNDQEKKYVKDQNKALIDFEREKLMCEPRPIIENIDLAKKRLVELIKNDKSKDECIRIINEEYKLTGNRTSDLWDELLKENFSNKNNNLQVIDEVKVIKGQFGYYHKSKEGIRFSNGENLMNDNITYSTKDEAMNKRNELTNEYLDAVKIINKQIEEFNKQLENANKAHETMNNRFDELEQVFDL